MSHHLLKSETREDHALSTESMCLGKHRWNDLAPADIGDGWAHVPRLLQEREISIVLVQLCPIPCCSSTFPHLAPSGCYHLNQQAGAYAICTVLLIHCMPSLLRIQPQRLDSITLSYY